jgi:hypothetical protein
MIVLIVHIPPHSLQSTSPSQVPTRSRSCATGVAILSSRKCWPTQAILSWRLQQREAGPCPYGLNRNSLATYQPIRFMVVMDHPRRLYGHRMTTA